jgi:peptidoglycan hydrolase-like protein with peptidoglycan-binding domain
VIKTGKELASACEKVAKNYKTLYVMGCFGAPMTDKNKARYTKNHEYNQRPARVKKINEASADTFGFDCVCLIKGLLWGWNGDADKVYGGSSYACNGVPDIGANSMIKVCKDVSTDFSKIEVGEAVWIDGHIGVYIGDGLAVESTPAWKNCVQITAVHNIGKKSGYNGRKWTKHGKLPYVEYTGEVVETVVKKEECDVTLPVLRKGYVGASAKALQMLLVGNGYSCGSAGVDGHFGNDTEKAVKAYQKARGLQIDGVVGSATWSSLLK